MGLNKIKSEEGDSFLTPQYILIYIQTCGLEKEKRKGGSNISSCYRRDYYGIMHGIIQS
jgi:hypothetical protein